MGSFWAWERLLGDQDWVEKEAREHRAARARREETDDAPPAMQCKACGYEGAERYCPHCLADTMVAMRSKVATRRRT